MYEILCFNMMCFKHEMKQETEIKVRIHINVCVAFSVFSTCICGIG